MGKLTFSRKSISKSSSFQDFLARKGGGSGKTALLLDISGSMVEVTKKGRSRWELLKEIIQEFEKFPKITFNNYATYLPSGNSIPHPAGGTELSPALKKALEVGIFDIIVISDGEIHDKAEAAELLSRFNSVKGIFVGDKSDIYGQESLKTLAKDGFFHEDISEVKKIQNTIKGFLPKKEVKYV